MKTQIRILGIDDSSFEFSDEKVRITGVVMRLPSYIEGVLVSEVAVDGLDSTDVIIEMVNRSRYKRQLKIIFIDGIALGGFNVVDIRKINRDTGIPVATVTRERPDFKEIESALRTHFSDWKTRLDMMKSGNLEEVELEGVSVFVDVIGLEFSEAEEILRASVIRGALPEPVRVAHLIGTAFAKGESHGRA